MSETVPFATSKPPLRSCDLEDGHDRRDRKRSGMLSCTLTTVTPLCIQSYYSKLTDRDPAFVPASSLRGMVRNVMEMLGAGCGRFYQEAPCPRHLETCTAGAACLVCRVFGFVEGEYGWAGKVRFGDTAPAKVSWVRYGVPMTGRPPQNRSHGDGWILFPHSTPQLSEDPRGVRCVPERQQFGFRVEYLNLDAEEYALFKFALTLKHSRVDPGTGRPIDLCHKLGFAKAVGLGSCTISIGNDKSPAVGAEIDPYLAGTAFGVFATHRRYR